MDGQKIIIQFDGHQVYLSDTHVISIDNVGLPESAREVGMTISTWTLRILKYIPEEKRIFTDILYANAGEENFPVEQIENPEINKIEKIDFKDVKTGLLLRFKNKAKRFPFKKSKSINPNPYKFEHTQTSQELKVEEKPHIGFSDPSPFFVHRN